MMATKSPGLPERLDGVQILRGVAATAVAWHHALETSKGVGYAVRPPEWLVLLGAAGVDIFFVISGFIMVYICARRGDVGSAGAGWRFLVNRARRIYPLYWVCCAVFLLAMALGFFSEKSIGPVDILASLALWPSNPRIVGISWTLSYEICFYLIFAASLLARTLRRAVLTAAAGILAMVLLSTSLLGSESFTASPITLEFVFGMMLALLYIRGAGRIGRIPTPLLVSTALAGFIGASIVFYAGTTHHLPPSIRFFAWGLPAVLLMVVALQATARETVAARVSVAVGDASYAIYLFHPIVLIVYAKAFEKLPILTVVSQWVWVPLVTLACVVAGWIAHVLIEKPLMKQLSGKRPAKPLSPQPRPVAEAGQAG